MKTLDEIQTDINELSNRLKYLEDAKINNDTISAGDILNIYEKITSLNVQLDYLRRVGNKAPQNLNSQNINNTNTNFNKQQNSQTAKPITQQFNTQNDKKAMLSEANAGKYIIGVLASILVLLAVAMFVKIIWNSIPNISKFEIIFALGIVLSAIGFLKIIKFGNKNGFWTSIAGCGTAVTFISIISGNLVWNLYGLIILGILIVIWFGTNFMLSDVANSNVFYIITYIGGIISIVLSAILISEQVTVINQIGFVIISLVIFGFGEYGIYKNKNKLIPLFNWFFALIVVLLPYNIDTYAYIIILAQIFMSAVLLFESQRLPDTPYIDSKVLKILLSGVSAVFILTSVLRILSVDSLSEYTISLLTGIITLLIMSVVTVAQKNEPERIKFTLFGISPIIMLSLSNISYGIFKHYSLLPLFITLILSLNIKIRENKAYRTILIIFYAISYYMFLEYINKDAEDIMVYISYFIFMAITAIDYIILTFKLNTSWKNIERTLDIALPFMAIYITSYRLPISSIIIILLFAVAISTHIIFVLNKTEYKNSFDYETANIICLIINIIIHIICYFYSVFAKEIYEKTSITATLILLNSVLIYKNLKSQNSVKNLILVFLCNINIFFLSFIWSDVGIGLNLSIIGIAISSMFITLGFMFKNKNMRILGLITIIVYVIKIVLLDVPLSNKTTSNIGMLLLGGIICYAISFVYNKLNKIYGDELNTSNDKKTEQADK